MLSVFIKNLSYVQKWILFVFFRIFTEKLPIKGFRGKIIYILACKNPEKNRLNLDADGVNYGKKKVFEKK
ncbi:MAG: hypothetical protein BRC45_12495 [Cyanobacteria bacterium QS_5_48_63]|nr:MAG: hypothetical protein BRC45_12495 [Cyanobacteria bacterium QS_5_48_63]